MHTSNSQDIHRINEIINLQYPPVNKTLLGIWKAEAKMPILVKLIDQWIEVVNKQKAMIDIDLFEEAERELALSPALMAAGGTVGSVKHYFENVDLTKLPPSAAVYFREQILTDPAIETFDIGNETFESVKSAIESINNKVVVPDEPEVLPEEVPQEEIVEVRPRIQPIIPIDLDAEPETPADAAPAEENERQVIEEELEALRVALKYATGEDKQEIEDAIDALNMALKYLPEQKKTGGRIAGTWDFVEKYYPNYDSSDDIAYNEDLTKIVNNEEQGGDDAYELLKNEFDGDREKAAAAKRESDATIYVAAIQGFIDETGKVSTVEEFVKRYNNGHPDQQEEYFKYDNAIGNYITRHPEEKFEHGGGFDDNLLEKGGKVGYIYEHDGEKYTASELIDFADAASEYDRRDASDSLEEYNENKITTVEQAIKYLGGKDEVKTIKPAKKQNKLNSDGPGKYEMFKDQYGNDVKGYVSTWNEGAGAGFEGLPIVYGVVINDILPSSFLVIAGILQGGILVNSTEAWPDWFGRETQALEVAYGISQDEKFGADELKKGGRLKSAINKDRKYTSQEEWEKDYKRKGRRHFYKEDGGVLGNRLESYDITVELSDKDAAADFILDYESLGISYGSLDIVDDRFVHISNMNTDDGIDEDYEKSIKFIEGKNLKFNAYQFEYKQGGRLKSAINRDRKYTSKEEWEKSYRRKARRHFYKKDGGKVNDNVIEFKGEEYPVRNFYVLTEGDGMITGVTIAGESLRSALSKAKFRGIAKDIDDEITGYVVDNILNANNGDQIVMEHLFSKSTYLVADTEVEDLLKEGPIPKMQKVDARKERKLVSLIEPATNFDIRINKKLAAALLNSNSDILNKGDIYCKELGEGGIWKNFHKGDLVNKKIPSKYKTFEIWITGDCEKEYLIEELNKFVNENKIK